jgi:hypothetical protein
MYGRTGVEVILGPAMVWVSCQPHAPPEPHHTPERPVVSFTPPQESARVSPEKHAPPRTAGAWTLTFDDPYPACPIAGHTARVGQVSQNHRGPLVKDSLAGRVRCTMFDDKPIKVHATASASGRGVMFFINSMSGQASEDQLATGYLEYMSANLDGMYEGPCTFDFTPASGASLTPGMIWVGFKCSLDNSENNALKCAVQGHATFEGCTAD